MGDLIFDMSYVSIFIAGAAMGWITLLSGLRSGARERTERNSRDFSFYLFMAVISAGILCLYMVLLAFDLFRSIELLAFVYLVLSGFGVVLFVSLLMVFAHTDLNPVVCFTCESNKTFLKN